MSVKAALFISTILLTVLPSNIRTFVVMDFFSNNGISKSNENQNPKKEEVDDEKCPSWKPFSCLNGECISLHYICDGSPDCSNNYDENKRLCTA
uniref:Uncharacterized protein n=1 Tax=Romanomermis culicivorax TaxID=13658 RepID=A0A915JXS9_ROMCU